MKLPRSKSDKEILGWRAWMNRISLEKDPDTGVYTINLDLMSLFFPKVWDGPVITADKMPTAFGDGERHGVYASKERRDLDEEGHIFVGEIGLSGLVIEHERGYRAERGVIRSMYFNQKALVEIMIQMLQTPGLAINLPQWEEVLRFMQGPECAHRLEATYACEVTVVATYNIGELNDQITSIKNLPEA